MRGTIVIALAVCVLAALMLPVCYGAAEVRGLWVDAFHAGFKSPEQTQAMVEKAGECGFNTLFVQVRRRGDVYYRSVIEPMASDVARGYDPLADIVAKAHAAGIEVHAWVTCLEVYHDNKWTPKSSGQVHLVHPDWLMKDDRGKAKFADGRVYLDPGAPEVRQYIGGIVAEIARNYDVDGVHLDAVKYPNEQAGYNDTSLAGFARQSKSKDKPKSDDDAWCDWRRAQMTELIRTAKQELKQAKGKAKLSVCVFANTVDSYFSRYQDWPGWLKGGLLDFAVPMVFPLDSRVFQTECASVLKAGGEKKIYIGQAGWRMNNAKSIEQITMALKAGAAGIVVYSYDGCRKPRKGGKTALMDELMTGLFAETSADNR